MFRDEWSLLDANDNPIGTVKEDSGLMSIIRRFFIKIIPQTFHVSINDQQVGMIKQRFNPFQLGYDVDFSKADGTWTPA